MKFLYTTFVLLIFLSCQNENDSKIITVKEFPKTIRLNHEKVNTPPVLFSTTNMLLTDDILIVYDNKAEYFFNVFKLPDIRHLGRFVKKGKGPSEEININQFIKKIKGNQFYTRTMGSIKTFEFNLINNEFKVIKKVSLPGETSSFQHLFQFNEDLYYGVGLFQITNKEFIGFNTTTGDIFDFGPKYPKVSKEIKPNLLNNVFSKIISVKPDKSKFTSAYLRFPFLRIYNKDGSLSSELHYENNQEFPVGYIMNEYSKTAIEKSMYNYWRLKSTNNFIYALYIGKTLKELKEEGYDDIVESNEIHVWDWKGNPVKKILLDSFIGCFEVTPDDSYIIGASANNINFLYKYKIDENE